MTNGKTFSLQMWQKILIGLILGIVAGFVVGEHAKLLKPIGDIFITLIRMVVMPVIFTRPEVPTTKAPQPVTVQVADRGLWLA